MIYLDHAATTPVPAEVARSVYDTLFSGWGNPSSQYPIGKDARDAVGAARETVAAALGCKASELIFTSCGSESDNWAIRLALHQNRHAGKHLITTAVEHSAILETCKALEQEGYSVTYLKPDKNGNITVSQVENALRDDTALVTMMLVNNETGCIFPVAEVAQLLKEKKSRALLHIDAVQGFLKIPFRADTLGADLISISGHKVGAPNGIGGLYLGGRVRAPQPLIYGGGQEQGLRSGTEATGQIAGFAKAVELRCEHLDETLAHMAAIKAYAEETLLALGGVVRVGNGQAPHILSVSLVGYPSANVVAELGSQGICISAGSACHRGQLSHVYRAMGLDKDRRGRSAHQFRPRNDERRHRRAHHSAQGASRHALPHAIILK